MGEGAKQPFTLSYPQSPKSTAAMAPAETTTAAATPENPAETTLISSSATTTTTDKPAISSSAAAPEFKLVGYSNFIRTNLRSDRFPVFGFHHIEFYCSDSTTTAGRFSFSLGMPLSSRSDLSTGNLTHSSLLLRSSSLQFLFSAPYKYSSTTSTSYTSPLPSFSPSFSHHFTSTHGLAVRAIAVTVSNAVAAFHISLAHGARPAFPPTDLGLGFTLSEVELYGDVVLRFISVPSPSTPSSPSFLPGFQDLPTPPNQLDYGIRRLDHAVGNVNDLASAVKYVAGFTGFHEFAEFTAADVGTAESGLNSVVLANDEETVLVPMNEPVYGTKRRSQIETYLEYNGGAGVQHLALASDDVIGTLRKMRAVSCAGGFEFLTPPPPTYYENLRRRVGDVLGEEKMRECEEMGVLVDRDEQGVLLQIFTKPVGDRPTIFIEIIQRIGCMVRDEGGKEYQKGGCGGFGKGNFSELFKSIEEYEKILEAKHHAAAPQA